MAQLRPLVAVAGASGFVGQALASTLAKRLRVAGISRAVPRAAAPAFSEWRRADLFNLREAEAALAGAKYAVYLVHSMLPSARLTQGSFADLDLVCADNFARAAKHAGVEQIVYLGGLIPESRGELSLHLESRLEVEKTLGAYGVPLTVLRAGMVIGGGGSSFQILERLVKRLPAMICPAWTRTRMQPVAVDDVVKLLAFAVGEPACFEQIFDVGAPEAMTYRELMALTAELLGVRRPMVPVPLFTPSLSRLWVTLITGAPGALVGPLVESLRHEMVARDHRLADMAGLTPTPVRTALERALAFEPQKRTRPAADSSPPAAAPIRERPHVRSVQRMHLPPGRDAAWAADEYARWIPRGLRGLLRVEVDPDRTCRFYFGSMARSLLELTYVGDRSHPDRQLFYVTGGLLTSSRPTNGGRARFELRQVLDRRTLVTAIHDYRPRLPWYVYRATQARVHAAVMKAFGRHLATAISES